MLTTRKTSYRPTAIEMSTTSRICQKKPRATRRLHDCCMGAAGKASVAHSRLQRFSKRWRSTAVHQQLPANCGVQLTRRWAQSCDGTSCCGASPSELRAAPHSHSACGVCTVALNVMAWLCPSQGFQLYAQSPTHLHRTQCLQRDSDVCGRWFCSGQ